MQITMSASKFVNLPINTLKIIANNPAMPYETRKKAKTIITAIERDARRVSAMR